VLVLPVESSKLLLPFYQGEATFREGRDITEKEYENGESVCLLPYRLAQRNQLKVGDTVELPLYLADYRYEPSKVFMPGNGMSDGGAVIPYKLLNAKQEPYPIFERNTYKVVGVYAPKGVSGMQTTGLELPDNGIIVPSRSIKNSDENNIAAVGPMQAGTTSFQIPNGTIRQYMENFNKLGITNLEITFYDGGYEQLKAGMDDVKSMGTLLTVSGAGAAIATILFFTLLFVQKQKSRTAIERSLGVTKTQCRISLLSGLLSVTLPGVALGGIAGYLATDRVFTKVNQAVGATFNTAFSTWVNHADTSKAVDLVKVSPWTALWVGIAVTAFVLLMSLAAIQKNLQAEPLEVLSRRDS
jgi:ABC-type antimicrobial peptide transport system permease subunit